MTQHTQGRLEVVNDIGSWSAEYDGYGSTCVVGVAVDGGPMVALSVTHTPNLFAEPDPIPNARRLVACWNYCIELDTGAMEVLTEVGKSAADHFQELGHEVAKLTSLNDELLKALKDARRELAYGARQKGHDAADAMIKKVEGA